jgi:hypothetical protein
MRSSWDEVVDEALESGALFEAWLWSLDASGNLAVDSKDTLVYKHLDDYFHEHLVCDLDSDEVAKLLDSCLRISKHA